MPDISMCRGARIFKGAGFPQDCPQKHECYRFLARPSLYQAYLGDPIQMKVGDPCEFFWEAEPPKKSKALAGDENELRDYYAELQNMALLYSAGQAQSAKRQKEEVNKMFKKGKKKDDAKEMDSSKKDVRASKQDRGADPFSHQVGGSHYKQFKIQPYEFFFRNKITHEKSAIIRRILRYDHPTGKGLEDLDKISHEIELIKKLWCEDNA